jgi:16S rRNA G1207 methylase RsmC
MLTAEEVRKALGLVPFEGYARKHEHSDAMQRVSEMMSDASKEIIITPRQTGRSTRMICSLLATISSGRPVAIYAKPQSVEHSLKDKAQEWAEKLGLNPKLILGHLASTAEIEFFDHSWYGVR